MRKKARRASSSLPAPPRREKYDAAGTYLHNVTALPISRARICRENDLPLRHGESARRRRRRRRRPDKRVRIIACASYFPARKTVESFLNSILHDRFVERWFSQRFDTRGFARPTKPSFFYLLFLTLRPIPVGTEGAAYIPAVCRLPVVPATRAFCLNRQSLC